MASRGKPYLGAFPCLAVVVSRLCGQLVRPFDKSAGSPVKGTTLPPRPVSSQSLRDLTSLSATVAPLAEEGAVARANEAWQMGIDVSAVSSLVLGQRLDGGRHAGGAAGRHDLFERPLDGARHRRCLGIAGKAHRLGQI